MPSPTDPHTQARHMAAAYITRFPVAGSKHQRLTDAIEANLRERRPTPLVWAALLHLGTLGRSAQVTPASLQWAITDLGEDDPASPVPAFDWDRDRAYAAPPNDEWKAMRAQRRTDVSQRND